MLTRFDDWLRSILAVSVALGLSVASNRWGFEQPSPPETLSQVDDRLQKPELAEQMPRPQGDLFVVLARSRRFDLLLNALIALDLDDLMRAEGSWTLLAPSNSVLEKLPEPERLLWMELNDRAKLETIVTDCLIPGRLDLEPPIDQPRPATLSGRRVVLVGNRLGWAIDDAIVLEIIPVGQSLILEIDKLPSSTALDTDSTKAVTDAEAGKERAADLLMD